MTHEIKQVNLPSGAILKLGVNPFEVSLALKEAVMQELKVIPFESQLEVAEIIKALFCSSVTSPQIKRCLWECFKRHTYDGGAGDLKIDLDTFQPLGNRRDYDVVCMEVAKHELTPFGKEGFVKFSSLATELFNSLRSK